MSFLSWLLNLKKGSATAADAAAQAACEELAKAATEAALRELAFDTCVNMIANAISHCEFKTLRGGRPIYGDEYWLWNFEPNINQNSSAFLHKLVDRLCRTGSALVVETTHRSGQKMLVVADRFDPPKLYPAKANEYTGVTVGEVAYDKTFREPEVMHFRLNHKDIKPVLDALTDSYSRLIQTAEKAFLWNSGRHLKVKVSRMEQGSENFSEKYRERMEKQLKPFMQSANAVLPEFDGYEYSNFGGDPGTERQTRDIRALADDIFTFTARGLHIPPVLVLGDVADTEDAFTRWLTTGIDPLCDQLQEEITRKRYGKDAWRKGDGVVIDTSTVVHYDMFKQAANVEKLIGSGLYSVNDLLAALGQPKIDEPWAEKHWMTLNIESVQNAARSIDT